MLSDTPLVKNLDNKDYMDILLDGKDSLEERFAEIDTKLVREELLKVELFSEKIPFKIKELIKKPELTAALISLF